MTAAGTSAGTEARRQQSLFEELTREAAAAAGAAARYRIAEITERRVADVLSVLSGRGYHLLPDRAWPGSRNANVDLIVVGPGGVFIVDTKAWADVSIVDGRIYRGQADVSDDLDNLADLTRNTDGVLAEIGLSPNEVQAVAVFAGRRDFRGHVRSVDIVGEHDVVNYIRRKGDRLSRGQVDSVVRELLDYFPVLHPIAAINVPLPAPATVAVTKPEPAVEVDKHEAFAPDSDLLAQILPKPIEEWMTFLDPAQARVARRSFNGPARIRGGAGTGKTVVGLHRTTYLARSAGPSSKVLFATFTKTLPDVFATLLASMAPDLVDRVDFTGIHAFALRLLRQRGIRPPLDPGAAENIFNIAYSKQPRDGAIRSRDGVTPSYWRDEVAHVIKGRGITSFEQYADLARIGRKHRLAYEQRKAVWALFESYESELRARGVVDFADVILLALRSLRSTPLNDYSSVIIDEAQDLSCAMVALLSALVGNRPDGLTLIGDGQQTIYPGGYALSEVGISLAGRGVVLSVNHRNTREILEFAATFVAGDEFADIEGVTSVQDAVAQVARTGPVPEVARFTSREAHDAAAVAVACRSLARPGTSAGDMAVLALTKADGASLRRAFAAAGIPTMDLDDYKGHPVDAIKVGTIKRAKGLEFKEVFVARVPVHVLADVPATASDTERERRSLLRREMFVGATRARDRLWLGVIGA